MRLQINVQYQSKYSRIVIGNEGFTEVVLGRDGDEELKFKLEIGEYIPEVN